MSIIPFNDAPVRIIKSQNTGSFGPIDTSAFDDFRQGIELTQEKYYYNGSIVKIHSGEPNNYLAVLNFGESEINIFDGEIFYDTKRKYSPLDFVSSNDILYFPPPFNDNIDLTSLDGTIEPLTIRDVITFASTYGKYEPHAIRSNLESGNYSYYAESDVQKLEYERSEQQGNLPFIDSTAVVGNIRVEAFDNLPPIPNISPYDDAQPPSAIFNNIKDDPTLQSNVWYVLNPDSETYISNKQVSTTKGRTYMTFDGSNADSLAFGDLRYTYR
jgi:hypothetical protein